MGSSKENLNKLLDFINLLIKEPGNEWFHEALKESLSTDEEGFDTDTLKLLYKDLSPPKVEKQKQVQTKESMSRIQSDGRPTKHQRKQIMAMKRNSSE